jgi:hypothetical protein
MQGFKVLTVLKGQGSSEVNLSKAFHACIHLSVSQVKKESVTHLVNLRLGKLPSRGA